MDNTQVNYYLYGQQHKIYYTQGQYYYVKK